MRDHLPQILPSVQTLNTKKQLGTILSWKDNVNLLCNILSVISAQGKTAHGSLPCHQLHTYL